MPRRAALIRHAGDLRPRLEQLAVELLGFRLGFEAKLALEDSDARLVLAEGSAAPALARIETHERSVHCLLRRVEAEQSHGGLHRLVDRTDLGLMAQELRERFHGQLSQSLPLRPEPVLERRLLDADPL